ncbi:MAG: hypothetical protein RLY78_3461 [Pseudomonadota bacterium]
MMGRQPVGRAGGLADTLADTLAGTLTADCAPRARAHGADRAQPGRTILQLAGSSTCRGSKRRITRKP